MTGRSRVHQYLRGERDVRALAAAAATDSDSASSDGLFSDLAAAWRLVRAYLRGEYREVRSRSVLAVIGALLYFISPMDLIPDVVVLLGFTDDVIVLSLAFRVLRQELAAFRAWEAGYASLDVTVLHTVRDG
ncbi:MAG: YkvA family protein [Nitriliruptoraceae bacterium]